MHFYSAQEVRLPTAEQGMVHALPEFKHPLKWRIEELLEDAIEMIGLRIGCTRPVWLGTSNFWLQKICYIRSGMSLSSRE